MITILVIVILGYIAIKVIPRLYVLKIDNTMMFTGAPGTGKTNEMINMALKLYRRTKFKVKIHNWLYRKKQWEQPKLYSNIPIRINKKEWSIDLKIEHLLLTERQNNRSITVITEIGKVASQYDWQNLNVQDNLNDYISLYRHYTLGGYFLCDDQSSDNVAVNIRRRLGTVVNMLHFRKFLIIYWVKMRNITISEDIKTIEDDSAETNMRWRFGLFPLFQKKYDTYSFSNRYLTVPSGTLTFHSQYKINKITSIPMATLYKGEIRGTKLEKLVSND